MKTRYQSGSAHIIIIIILVVALLGALGFIFWQNFVNKQNTSNNASTSNTTNTSAPEKPSDQTAASGLTISEWGIKIPMSDTLTYAMNGTDYVTVYSPDLTQAEKDANCSENNGVSLYRTTSLDNVAPSDRANVKQIGSYYYGTTRSSQALCVGQGDAKGTDKGDSTVNNVYERFYATMSITLLSKATEI